MSEAPGSGEVPSLPDEIHRILDSVDPILETVRRAIEILRPAVASATQGFPVPKRGIDVDLIRRAIIQRAIDFTESLVYMCDSDKHKANAQIFLRPMCEDRIFLGWLDRIDQEVAENFVSLKSMLDVTSAARAQEDFLRDAYKSYGDKTDTEIDRIVLQVNEELHRSIEDKFHELMRQNGWNKYGPSVKKMAEHASLLEFYQFFYFASSRSVHANLHSMGRMAWFDDSKLVSLSNDKMANLHKHFALVYGLFLLFNTLQATATHFKDVAQVLESDEFAILLALVLTGPARNGQLPPLITEAEIRHPPRNPPPTV